MKINYKNTALNFLDDPTKMEFYLADDGKNMTEAERLTFGHSVREAFPDVSQAFKEKIRLISKPFTQAYVKAKHKLAGVWDSIEFNESGTLIFPGPDRTNTVFYMVITNGKKDDWQYKINITTFTKQHKGNMPGLDVLILETPTTSKHFIWKGYLDQGQDSTFWIADLISLLTFIRFCEIETKVIFAGKRGHHTGEKYVNETKSDVEILDSTWFTTIVRSEGFSVGKETGGFFRLQPCGKDLSDRKLKWIMPFEKEGYTRKARILTQDSSEKSHKNG